MTELEMREHVKLQNEIAGLKRSLNEMTVDRDYEKDRAENAEFEKADLLEKNEAFENINRTIRNFLRDECGMPEKQVWEKVPEHFEISKYDYR